MAFEKGHKLGGRPPGTRNKLTVSAKEAFVYAFDAIGGADKLAAWALDNPTEFYRLFSKLIPVAVDAKVEHKEARELSDDELLNIASASRAGIIKPADGEDLIN